MKINDNRYWEDRFENDWELMSGRQQTLFFANIALELLPKWLKSEMEKDKLTIYDVGCALGDGTDLLRRYLNTKVVGLDFSKYAIDKAKIFFPECEFRLFDILNDCSDSKADVVFSSNVIEHFENPFEIIKKLCDLSSKYVILMFPFEEEMNIEEHLFKFNLENIRINYDEFNLIYVSSEDCNKINNTYYGDNQILLVYSCLKKFRNLTLWNYVNNLQTKRELSIAYELLESKEKSTFLINDNNQKNNTIIYLQDKLEQLSELLNNLNNQLLTKDNQLKDSEMLINKINSELVNKTSEVEEIKLVIEKKSKELETIHNDLLWHKKHIYDLEMTIQEIYNSFSWKCTKIFRYIKKFIKSSKLYNLLTRIKKSERKLGTKFFYLVKKLKCFNYIKKFVPKKIKSSLSVRYSNPNYYETKDENLIDKIKLFINDIKEEERIIMVFSGVKYIDNEGQRNIRLINEALKKGKVKIIYLYWRWNVNEPVESEKESLFQIPIDIFNSSYANYFNIILPNKKNKIFLIEFPHEIAAKLLDVANCYNWITIYDVIDDWEEFYKLGEAGWFKKQIELRIAKNVDINIATAKRLKEKIVSEIDVNSNYYIVGNGVDPGRLKPSKKISKYNYNKGDVQIGYFGHLTNAWFDWDMIINIANEKINWTFHIIGYGQPENLKLPNNIIIYGKKDHEELAKYAAFWDVAIIPFINSELTLSVNPIKVYEYLQLGLPVVASNMPEIKDYPYTLIRVGKEGFINGINEALEFKKAMDPIIINNFVNENTWEKKYSKIIKYVDNYKFDITYKSIL